MRYIVLYLITVIINAFADHSKSAIEESLLYRANEALFEAMIFITEAKMK